ncbi:ABC transporter permease [Paenibacillus flagellatus]|uniref:Metabolite permease n=1 Tax=Paenibacillus flagellatus TaxID=2211139 RepID=A0A2V5KP00_9BACL|nr:ABC transporter permease [Paenibacillus flagellatus]PYI57090.1 metabolite permease [Paenibacillus flagellatus]
MKGKDKYRFVRQNMKKNRSRVFMTVLATAIGCSFLIVLASVGFGLQRSVVDDITRGRLLTVIDTHGVKDDKDAYRQIGDADIRFLESVDHVKAVTRRYQVAQPATYLIGDRQGIGMPTVADMAAESKAGFELAGGRMPQNGGEAVVGYHFADSMRTAAEQAALEKGQAESSEPVAPSPKPADGALSDKAKALLGQTLTIRVKQRFGSEEKTFDVPVTIVGIGKAPGREWNQDNELYVDEAVMQRIESFTQTAYGVQTGTEGRKTSQPGEPRVYNEVQVYADQVEHVKGVVEKLKERNFATYSIVDQIEQVNAVFLVMKIGLILVGTIAVLIASIGIYNTMTMAVTERTPDIGIMKAIGAHPSTIKSVFLLESAFIGLLGAAIGTAVAYAVSFAVNLALPLVVHSFVDGRVPEGLRFSEIPPSLTLICVAISLLVAVVSGVRPAVRATRVDVLKALRRDI